MTKDLTEGSPARLIFLFTMPLIAGNIFQQLYSFVDTLLVGRFLGVEALAAVGCTGSLMFLMIGFIIGLTSGLSIYTGQCFGARDTEGVHQSAAACTLLSAGLAVLLTIVGMLSSRFLLVFMQTPPEILEGAVSFITIIYGGIGVTIYFMMGTNLIRALGDSRTPTILLALALCFNIVLEPLFLLVFGWGIPGAAWAMVASQLFGALLCTAYIVKKVPALHIRSQDWQLSQHFLYEHLRIGIPMAFQASIIAIGAVILQVALNNLGPIAVASYAASQKVDSIAMMPMMSFGIAMASYTAQNFGARKFDRIKEGVRKCIFMSVSFSLLAGLFNIFFGPSIMYLFVGDGQEQVIQYGQTYLTINGACYFILSLLFIYRYTLQGLGQSIVPTIAGIMELIMRALAAVFLVQWFGFTGACWASPLAWLGSCVPLAVAYYVTSRSLHCRLAKEAAGVPRL